MQLQIGVKVLIRNSENKYLFLHRSTQNLQDAGITLSLDIPGGRIDSNESLMRALKREMKEEIGIELVAIPRLITAQDIFATTKNLHVIRLTYLLEMDIENINLSEEHDTYQWLQIEETNTHTIEPYLKEVLDLLATKETQDISWHNDPHIVPRKHILARRWESTPDEVKDLPFEKLINTHEGEVDEKNIYELGVKAVAATWQSLIKGRDFKEFPLRTKL